MTLQDYDLDVKPVLHRIEYFARLTCREAKDLIAKTAFKSLTEEQLIEMHKVAAEFHSLACHALAHYQAKQPENEI